MTSMTSRRQLVQTQSLGHLSSLMLAVPFVAKDPSDLMGIVVNHNERKTIQLTGETAIAKTIMEKNKGVQSIAFFCEFYKPGHALPVHKHLEEDELIFLRKGSALLTLGDNHYQIKKGAFVFVTRGVWHGLQNNGSDDMEVLFRYSTLGFKDILTKVGTQIDHTYINKQVNQRRAIAKKWGMIFKD